MADPFNFKYIQPSFQEIFKTAAPTTAQKKAESADPFYANFEDIMKEQGGKKKK